MTFNKDKFVTLPRKALICGVGEGWKNKMSRRGNKRTLTKKNRQKEIYNEDSSSEEGTELDQSYNEKNLFVIRRHLIKNKWNEIVYDLEEGSGLSV